MKTVSNYQGNDMIHLFQCMLRKPFHAFTRVAWGVAWMGFLNLSTIYALPASTEWISKIPEWTVNAGGNWRITEDYHYMFDLPFSISMRLDRLSVGVRGNKLVAGGSRSWSGAVHCQIEGSEKVAHGRLAFVFGHHWHTQELALGYLTPEIFAPSFLGSQGIQNNPWRLLLSNEPGTTSRYLEYFRRKMPTRGFFLSHRYQWHQWTVKERLEVYYSGEKIFNRDIDDKDRTENAKDFLGRLDTPIKSLRQTEQKQYHYVKNPPPGQQQASLNVSVAYAIKPWLELQGHYQVLYHSTAGWSWSPWKQVRFQLNVFPVRRSHLPSWQHRYPLNYRSSDADLLPKFVYSYALPVGFADALADIVRNDIFGLSDNPETTLGEQIASYLAPPSEGDWGTYPSVDPKKGKDLDYFDRVRKYDQDRIYLKKVRKYIEENLRLFVDRSDANKPQELKLKKIYKQLSRQGHSDKINRQGDSDQTREKNRQRADAFSLLKDLRDYHEKKQRSVSNFCRNSHHVCLKSPRYRDLFAIAFLSETLALERLEHKRTVTVSLVPLMILDLERKAVS